MSPAIPGGASERVDWEGVAAILDGKRSPAGADLRAAAAEDAARLAALVAVGGGVPARVQRFVAASVPETRWHVLQRLRPGVPARPLAALRVLLAAAGDLDAGLWRFAIQAALGRPTPAAGTAPLVGQVVAHLAPGGAAEPRVARRLLDALAAAPHRSPALAAELTAALRAIADGADREPTEQAQVTRTAGLVLVAPYLPTLFERLELADRAGFRSPDATLRALDVLHALAHGEAAVRAGGRPLERLLCALPPDRPLPPPLPLPPRELAVVDDLLGSVIARWGALGRTSVAGLREAFLQREGLLRPAEAGAALEVAPRAYDVLLDRLPWSVALVKLAWMVAPIHVEWRK